MMHHYTALITLSGLWSGVLAPSHTHELTCFQYLENRMTRYTGLKRTALQNTFHAHSGRMAKEMRHIVRLQPQILAWNGPYSVSASFSTREKRTLMPRCSSLVYIYIGIDPTNCVVTSAAFNRRDYTISAKIAYQSIHNK